MVIYIDVLLFINLIVNYLLLCMVALVLRQPRRRPRLAAAAALGAAMSLTILLPALPLWGSLLLKLAGAVALCRCAFPYKGVRRLLQSSVALFAASALTAGAVAALAEGGARGVACNNLSIYVGVSPLLLVGACLVCYGALALADRLFVHPRASARPVPGRLTLHGRTIALPVLVDSGSGLCEPLSGRWVVLVDRRLAPKLLSGDALTAALSGVSDARAMREAGALIIPYTSVGGDGALPGFPGAALRLKTKNDETERTDLVAAFCEHIEGADAILPLHALEE